MFRLLVLAALIACISSFRISPLDCGRRPLVNNQRIVNGTIATPGDFAWSVSLNRQSHFCGGILIGKRWVLSAAHCFSSTAQITVRAVHDRRNPESWALSTTSERIFVHESYSSFSYANDIALIRLSEDFEYSDYVIPACIAESPDEYKKDATSFDDLIVGDPAYLTGWGHLFSGGAVQNLKNVVRLDAQTDDWCKNYYNKLVSTYNTKVHICAGSPQSFAGACQGDSGGPWVTASPIDGRWFNWGQTSWGFGCGQGTVFSRTSNYIDWIKSKLAMYPLENDF